MGAFNVEDYNPKRNPAYSAAIYKWLRKCRLPWVTAWRGNDGMVLVGWLDEDVFVIGASAKHMAHGHKADPGAYSVNGFGLTRDDALWAEYGRIGVCAFIPAHRYGPQPWTTDGDVRTCQWCGHTQRLRRWEEVVTREEWEVVP